jgi:molybdopterin synthase catalytic subunit
MPMAYLTTTPIAWDRVAYLERGSAQHGCGAVVTFVGVVRADRIGGRTVRALFYDAYAEMAESLLHRLVHDARARWALDGVQIQHRLGLVEAGQVSVVVAVAARHRAEAYAASQCLVEGIKHQVPIWKRELYDDGASKWVMCSPAVVVPADPLGAVHAHV